MAHNTDHGTVTKSPGDRLNPQVKFETGCLLSMIDDDSVKELLTRLQAEEDRRVMYLQGMVDTAVLKIMNARMTRQESLNLVLKIRALAGELFPDAMETFNLIYLNRFKRIIDEFALPDEEE